MTKMNVERKLTGLHWFYFEMYGYKMRHLLYGLLGKVLWANSKLKLFTLFAWVVIVQPDALADPFVFKLTKGNGVPVCNAYLKRLNSSDFDNAPPFCGRPEDDSVSGFTYLKRVPLSAEEIHGLQLKMDGFQSMQNQNQWQIQLKNNIKQEMMPLESVRSDMGMSRLGAWRYDPPVDIDNDGQPDNVLMWYRGYGAGGCGSINGFETYPEHGSYTANILDANNQFIDEVRTRKLFGHPVGGFPITKAGKSAGFFPGFRYVGTSMGIFAYEGAYYFDTFFDGWGDFQGKRFGYFGDGKPIVSRINLMTATLGVFQRKDGKTKQICEYHWINWKDLEMGRNTK